MSKKKSWELPPVRPLDDCFARFQIPKDLEKWKNPLISNLLYYQTNYFLLSIIILIIFGVIHPIKMMYGFLTTLVFIFMIFIHVKNEKINPTHFKRDHPIASILITLAGGYFVVYMLSSLVVFLLGILLPFGITLIHASLRLRTTKNKVDSNLFETPMGRLIEIVTNFLLLWL